MLTHRALKNELGGFRALWLQILMRNNGKPVIAVDFTTSAFSKRFTRFFAKPLFNIGTPLQEPML